VNRDRDANVGNTAQRGIKTAAINAMQNIHEATNRIMVTINLGLFSLSHFNIDNMTTKKLH